MSAPVLTPSQIIAITAAKNVADAGVIGAIDSAAAWNLAVIQQQEIDDALKAFFDFYDSDVVRRYETERRWLDGDEIALPVIEQDIIDFAEEDNTSRLWNDTKIPERIDEFDGIPLVPTDDEHENFLVPDQDVITGWLQSFVAQITSFDVTALTTTALNLSSTTLSYESDVVETLSVNDLLFIGNGTDGFIVQVDSIGGSCSGEDNPPQATQGACEADNGTWTIALGITILVGTTGTIALGAALGRKSYGGFDNTERTNKVANDSDFQSIMTALLDDLEFSFNRRKTVLNNQIIELQANDDSGLDATAETKAQASITAIDGFLGGSPTSSIDISDTGITAIEVETAARLIEVTARITAIGTAITAGDYFNLRYDSASDRARLDNGSLRLLNEYTKARDDANASSATAQGLSDRYDSLLNP